MQPADNEFFERYKRLDKLCADMYSCQNGVSEYIAQMESKAYHGQSRVSSWGSDYKMLKHVRWVRNQIAHDSGSYQISESEDSEFVRAFYDRIFSGQDPLTLLRKAVEAENERRRQQKKQQREAAACSASPADMPPNRNLNRRIGVIIGAGVLAYLLIIFFLIMFFLSR